MRWLVILILLVVVVGYLFMGGAVFRALESDQEQDTKTVSRERIQKFLAEVPCVAPEQVEALITEVVKAYDQGVFVTNQSEANDNWDLVSSISFSLTVITTIGYGHVSPSTLGGRIFCIFYAIFGIPICAILLAGIGEKLHKPVKKLKSMATNGQLRVLITFLVYLSGVTLLVLLPAVGFRRSEDWTYFESIYYCVITLTTIGFGDFVPGTFGSEDMVLRRALTMVWIFVGLAWVSSMFSAVQDFISTKTVKKDSKTKYNGNMLHIQENLHGDGPFDMTERKTRTIEDMVQIVDDTPQATEGTSHSAEGKFNAVEDTVPIVEDTPHALEEGTSHNTEGKSNAVEDAIHSVDETLRVAENTAQNSEDTRRFVEDTENAEANTPVEDKQNDGFKPNATIIL